MCRDLRKMDYPRKKNIRWMSPGTTFFTEFHEILFLSHTFDKFVPEERAGKIIAVLCTSYTQIRTIQKKLNAKVTKETKKENNTGRRVLQGSSAPEIDPKETIVVDRFFIKNGNNRLTYHAKNRCI